MASKNKFMKSLDELYQFLKKNEKIIVWNNIESEILKFDAQIKKSIVPSNIIRETFSNKKLFPTQASIKKFLKDNFNIDIKNKSNIDIFSEITYYSLKMKDLISKIENLLKSAKVEEKAKPQRKPKVKQEIVINETWNDWTKLNPNDLTQHLKTLTVPQIKSVAKFLSSAEKKLNKIPLIETIVNKIKNLNAHYEMGPR